VRTGREVLQPRARLVVAALVLALLPFLGPLAPAHAEHTALCNGYAACKQAGYGSSGYQNSSGHMYWRMYGGHNCTNYAAYRMVKAGMPDTRPWTGGGNAENWGHAMAFLTDKTPMVGAVAWWDAYDGYAGSVGHVAYVEEVVSSTEIIISEDMWGGDFHWRRVTKTADSWPTGFIHFRDVALKNKQAPAVTGNAQVGETLTASPGTWSSTPDSYAYQWFADGQAISGATASTLVLGPARVGQQVTVQVTASAAGYAAAIATSPATTGVAPGVIVPVDEPVISGEPRVGAALTVTKGTYAPGSTAKTVQWQADGTPIAGATGWSLDLGEEQAGAVVTATVTATRKGYDPVTVSAAPTSAVLGGEVKVTSPFTVEDEPRVGVPLQVTAGVFEPADATVTYTWLRDGEEIPGASGSAPSYVPVGADVGHRLTVRVDLTKQGWKRTSQTTDATGPVHSVPRVQVSVAGKRQRAEVIVALTAPGVDTVGGQVSIRVGAKTVTVDLRDGMRRVVVTGLHAGTKPVTVTYLGQDLVDPGSYEGRVEVLPKKKPRKG
jgi:surface antigen